MNEIQARALEVYKERMQAKADALAKAKYDLDFAAALAAIDAAATVNLTVPEETAVGPTTTTTVNVKDASSWQDAKNGLIKIRNALSGFSF